MESRGIMSPILLSYLTCNLCMLGLHDIRTLIVILVNFMSSVCRRSLGRTYICLASNGYNTAITLWSLVDEGKRSLEYFTDLWATCFHLVFRYILRSSSFQNSVMLVAFPEIWGHAANYFKQVVLCLLRRVRPITTAVRTMHSVIV